MRDPKALIEEVAAGASPSDVVEAERATRMPKNTQAIEAGTVIKAIAGELKTIKRSDLAWLISDMIDNGQLAPADVKATSRAVQAIRKNLSTSWRSKTKGK